MMYNACTCLFFVCVDFCREFHTEAFVLTSFKKHMKMDARNERLVKSTKHFDICTRRCKVTDAIRSYFVTSHTNIS